MEDKRLRISVEDQKLKDLGRTATELANDMIRQSRQYSTSSKEVLKDLEDQIKLIEKRNRLDTEKQQTGLQTRFAAGEITRPQLQSGLQTIRGEGREDKLQVTLLRELIDTIKQTSKNEIREDRIGVEKRVRADKSINTLGVTGDPQEALKNTIQQALLGDLGEEEQTQRGKFKAFGKFGQGAGRTFNTAASLGTSKNEFYAGAAILGMMPVVGQGLSNIATRMLSSSEGIGTEKEKYARSRGLSINYINDSNLTGTSRDIGKLYGMNAQEVMSRRTSYYDMAKSSKGGIDLFNLLGAETNLGLSQQDIGGLYGSSRHRQTVSVNGGNSDSIPQLIANFNKYLKDSKQTQSVLPEILNSYRSIASQISQSGYVNPTDLSQRITGIAETSGLKGQHLDRFMGGVQGLSKSSNPITKSLMMRSFRQSNPNASLWDIQTMMESPFEHLDEMGDFMSNLKTQTGGGDMYKQVLHSMFGDNLNRRDIDLITAKEADIGKILKSKRDEASLSEELGGSSSKVSEMTRSQKAMDAMFQEFGDKAVVWSDSLIDKLEGKITGMFSGEVSSEAEENKREEYRKMREAVSDGVVDGYMQTKYMP